MTAKTSKWKTLTEQGKVDALVWLSARWRQLGEFWSGTAEDAAYQQCANDILMVAGLEENDHLLAPGNFDSKLKQKFGVDKTPERSKAAAAAANRAIVPGSRVDDDINSHFMNTAVSFLQDSYGRVRKEEVAKLSALLSFAYETGYELGEKVGAETARITYTRKDKRSK